MSALLARFWLLCAVLRSALDACDATLEADWPTLNLARLMMYESSHVCLGKFGRLLAVHDFLSPLSPLSPILCVVHVSSHHYRVVVFFNRNITFLFICGNDERRRFVFPLSSRDTIFFETTSP